MRYRVVKAWAHRTNKADVIMRYETYLGDPIIENKKPVNSYEDCEVVRVEIRVPVKRRRKL